MSSNGALFRRWKAGKNCHVSLVGLHVQYKILTIERAFSLLASVLLIIYKWMVIYGTWPSVASECSDLIYYPEKSFMGVESSCPPSTPVLFTGPVNAYRPPPRISTAGTPPTLHVLPPTLHELPNLNTSRYPVRRWEIQPSEDSVKSSRQTTVWNLVVGDSVKSSS